MGKISTFKKNIIKIILLGEMSIGKTSIAVRFTDDYFPDPESLKSTIGANFYAKLIEYNSANYLIQLWDFGGQHIYRSFMSNLFIGASGGLFVFDLTNRDTFFDIVDFWIPETINKTGLDEKLLKNHFFLVGNKKDLADKRNVFADEISELVNKYDFMYYETSAKLGWSIDELFNDLLELILKNHSALLGDKSSVTAGDKEKKRGTML